DVFDRFVAVEILDGFISLALVDDFARVFFSSRRRHTRCYRDWSSDVCSSDLTVLGPRLTLRRWRAADAPVLSRAVEESLDHLRPWMSWAADEPLSLPARAAVLRTFESNWRRGSEVVLGAFADAVVVGGCGLVQRSD